MDFIKKNYEIFVVNIIVLVFIAITLLAQFGIQIEVDRDVDLVPVEIGYSQATRYSRGRGAAYASERYVRLKYEDDEQESFWVPASVVFGRDDDIEDMIKDGDSINGNVFYNTNSDKVVGVTKSGGSLLSLYYHNSKMFRYGIWILLVVDIFVGFLIGIKNKKEGNP